MKTDWSEVEPFRYNKISPYKSEPGDKWGMFVFPHGAKLIRCMVSDGLCELGEEIDGWEHVSVSISVGRDLRTPTWEEMCFVKNRFWTEDDVVVQFHPAKSEYVNFHKHCLHLWRHITKEFPIPPSILVGPKENKSQQ